MTLAEIQKVLDRFEFRMFPTRLRVRDMVMAGLKIEASVEVKDRDTGKPTTVIGTYFLPAECTKGDILRAVRIGLREFVLHEFDETLRFDGDLVNDPHAPCLPYPLI